MRMLERLRRYNRMSQLDLARESGVDPMVISRAENHGIEPSFEDYHKLENVLYHPYELGNYRLTDDIGGPSMACDFWLPRDKKLQGDYPMTLLTYLMRRDGIDQQTLVTRSGIGANYCSMARGGQYRFTEEQGQQIADVLGWDGDPRLLSEFVHDDGSLISEHMKALYDSAIDAVFEIRDRIDDDRLTDRILEAMVPLAEYAMIIPTEEEELAAEEAEKEATS